MKTPTAKQAIAQILKMNSTAYNIECKMEREAGNDWHAKKQRNEARSKKIQDISKKIEYYTQFVDEDSFNNSELPCTLCCNYSDFKN